MRAAAIFGLGSSPKDLLPFQRNSDSDWVIGLPADSNEVDAILIFGGDGTVHRHLTQLVKLQLPVLVVPCGSGNDFARALNLANVQVSLAAWRTFSSGSGNVRTIDLGVITELNVDGRIAGEALAAHYFCCVGGVGLDAEVARRANQLPRWLRGHGGYLLSFLPALLGFAPIPMKISLPLAENRNAFFVQRTGPIMVAAFANAPWYGGGMKIAPQAKLDDGSLDVCLIQNMNKVKLCCLFPTVYFGAHASIAGVENFQAERLRLETEQPFDVFADGEYVCRTPIEVSIAPGALRVISRRQG